MNGRRPMYVPETSPVQLCRCRTDTVRCRTCSIHVLWTSVQCAGRAPTCCATLHPLNIPGASVRHPCRCRIDALRCRTYIPEMSQEHLCDNSVGVAPTCCTVGHFVCPWCVDIDGLHSDILNMDPRACRKMTKQDVWCRVYLFSTWNRICSTRRPPPPLSRSVLCKCGNGDTCKRTLMRSWPACPPIKGGRQC